MARCPTCGREFEFNHEGEGFCPLCSASDAPLSPATEHPVAAHFRRFPATAILIALNVLVFLAMTFLGHVSAKEPTAGQLIHWGADSGELVLLHHQWWRIFSSAFVHIGAAHLLMNMWALWVLGTLAEAVLGTYLYVGIYIVSAIAGALASLYGNPLVVGAGASGALMGIVGAVVSVLKFARLPLPQQVLRSTLRSLIQGVLITLAIGVLPRIDNAAHLGGLLCGLLVGLLLSWSRITSYRLQRPLRHLAVFAPLCLMVPLAFAVRRHGEPEIHYQQAIEQLRRGDYVQAEKEAQLAIRRRPDRSDYLGVLSAALLGENKDVEALPYLERLLAQDPRNTIATNGLAMIRLRQGDLIGARDALAKSLAVQPRNAVGHMYLGQALAALNQDREAMAHYRAALQLDPDLLEAELGLAGLHEKYKEAEAAIQLYRAAAQTHPGAVEPLRGLARVYLANGMKRQADETIGQIRRLEEGKGDIGQGKSK